jgi:hypothetical protein
MLELSLDKVLKTVQFCCQWCSVEICAMTYFCRRWTHQHINTPTQSWTHQRNLININTSTQSSTHQTWRVDDFVNVLMCWWLCLMCWSHTLTQSTQPSQHNHQRISTITINTVSNTSTRQQDISTVPSTFTSPSPLCTFNTLTQSTQPSQHNHQRISTITINTVINTSTRQHVNASTQSALNHQHISTPTRSSHINLHIITCTVSNTSTQCHPHFNTRPSTPPSVITQP